MRMVIHESLVQFKKYVLLETQMINANLLRSYLIKGLAVPLVAIKYQTISTNLLNHLNRNKR
jgi:hypothetical protein